MHLLRGRMQIPTCSSAQKGFAVTQECGQAAWACEFLPAYLLQGSYAQKSVIAVLFEEEKSNFTCILRIHFM